MQIIAQPRARLALEMCGLVPQLALPRLLAGGRAKVVIDPVSYRPRCRLLARVKVGAKVVADVEHVPEKTLSKEKDRAWGEFTYVECT